MGLLTDLVKTAVNVASTPVDLMRDVVSTGDNKKSHTVKRAEDIEKNLKDILDDLF